MKRCELAALSSDEMQIIKLYPEGKADCRLKKSPENLERIRLGLEDVIAPDAPGGGGRQ